jgi:hypothetical protein
MTVELERVDEERGRKELAKATPPATVPGNAR